MHCLAVCPSINRTGPDSFIMSQVFFIAQTDLMFQLFSLHSFHCTALCSEQLCESQLVNSIASQLCRMGVESGSKQLVTGVTGRANVTTGAIEKIMIPGMVCSVSDVFVGSSIMKSRVRSFGSGMSNCTNQEWVSKFKS